MKKICLTFVAVMLLLTGSVFGNISDKNLPAHTLKEQVQKMLENFHTQPGKDIKASILFVINPENEIVVLSVKTDNPDFKEYVKTSLNYKSVNTSKNIKGKKYVLQIKVLS